MGYKIGRLRMRKVLWDPTTKVAPFFRRRLLIKVEIFLEKYSFHFVAKVFLNSPVFRLSRIIHFPYLLFRLAGGEALKVAFAAKC